MSELDKLNDIIRSFGDLANVSVLTSANVLTVAQQIKDAAVELRREELFNALAVLSSVEFAKVVQEKTDATKHGYSVSCEFYIQEQVCTLLAYNAMSQDEILSKMDDGSFNGLLLALGAIKCMPPMPPKNVYDDFLDDYQHTLDHKAIAVCIEAPFRSADWRHLAEGSVQVCTQFECEPNGGSDKETE